MQNPPKEISDRSWDEFFAAMDVMPQHEKIILISGILTTMDHEGKKQAFNLAKRVLKESQSIENEKLYSQLPY